MKQVGLCLKYCMKKLQVMWNFMKQVGLCLKYEEALGIAEYHEVGRIPLEVVHEEALGILEFHGIGTGLSLKRDPVDRDHVEDRAKRLGAIL